MPDDEATHESEIVTLVAGLIVVFGLAYISLLALVGGWALGLIFGTVELVVAWRVTPPPGALILRPIAAVLGALTVGWSIAELFVR